MIAGSLLLCSWILVLGPVFDAGGDSSLDAVDLLAYPMGDVVVDHDRALHVAARAARHAGRSRSRCPLVGTGLVAFAVADCGFTLPDHRRASTARATSSTSAGSSASRSSCSPPADAARAGRAPRTTTGRRRPLGILLPYIAVVDRAAHVRAWRCSAPATRTSFVSWVRTLIIAAARRRQVLTLLENQSLTRNLERRVPSAPPSCGPASSASRRWCSTAPTSSPWSTPTAVVGTRASRSSGSSATSRSDLHGPPARRRCWTRRAGDLRPRGAGAGRGRARTRSTASSSRPAPRRRAGGAGRRSRSPTC